MILGIRLSQLLKGAVVLTLCQNEAEVKCQMDIYQHISLTEKAGAMRLIELTQSKYFLTILYPQIESKYHE